VFVYYARHYKSALVGKRLVDVQCDRCRSEYYYELARVGSGVGTAHYGIGSKRAQRVAEERARFELNRQLERDAELVRRVEVWRGGLGRSLFSPVGPPFRLRVSHHLDHAPSPHPAHRTGRAGLPHPALGQNTHSLRSRHGYGSKLAELHQSQFLVQVTARVACVSRPRLLVLLA
jgi:hypothetical protein